METFNFKHFIADIPDYPQKGVVFKDITPLLADKQAFSTCIESLAHHFASAGVTKVMGAEARGFMFGSPVAHTLHAGFVPARKPGKLPRETLNEKFSLEYGSDELQIHADALTPHDKVLIVDDLIATGGTACAQAQLIKRAGAQLVGMGVLLELAFLHPRQIFTQFTGVELFSLVKVN